MIGDSTKALKEDAIEFVNRAHALNESAIVCVHDSVSGTTIVDAVGTPEELAKHLANAAHHIAKQIPSDLRSAWFDSIIRMTTHLKGLK